MAFLILSFPIKRTGSPIKNVGDESSVFSFFFVRNAKTLDARSGSGMTEKGKERTYGGQMSAALRQPSFDFALLRSTGVDHVPLTPALSHQGRGSG